MSITGLDVFDRTVHTTNRWLHELMGLLDGGSRHDAYAALRATLHALRDRLPVEETAELAAQLPMLVRGATHLFEEPGALDQVARLAREWFERHLTPAQARMQAG